MQDTLIFYKKNNATVSAGFRNNKLYTFNIDESENIYKIGNVYVGHIVKVLLHLNAAYVDIGMSKPCYMEIKKNFNYLTDIDHPDGEIHAGDNVLVQIEKEPNKYKPSTVSPEISINNRYVLVKYGSKSVNFSSKIKDKEFKKQLKNYFEEKLPENHSVLFRTNAYGASLEDIEKEFNYSLKKLEELENNYKMRLKGSLMYESAPNYIVQIRDNNTLSDSKIVTDDPEIYTELKSYISEYQPNLINNLEFYSDKNYSFEALYDMKKHISEITAQRVWLKSGACIVIEQTEALCSIDVNTAKASAEVKNFKDGFYKINLEAAEEIFRQIKLRNLYGIIVIDFINDKEHSSQELFNEVSDMFSDDPTIQVVDITKLGLIEVTRIRKGVSSSDLIKKYEII